MLDVVKLLVGSVGDEGLTLPFSVNCCLNFGTLIISKPEKILRCPTIWVEDNWEDKIRAKNIPIIFYCAGNFIFPQEVVLAVVVVVVVDSHFQQESTAS